MSFLRIIEMKMRSVGYLLCAYFGMISTNAVGQIQVFGEQLPIDSVFNTAYDEINIVISPDDARLYITRAGHPQSVGGNLDKGEIWESEITVDGSWSTLVAQQEINTEGLNQAIGFLDPRTLLTLRDNRLISYYRYSGKWFEPTPFDIPYLKVQSDHLSGSVSSDANFILLAMESFGSHGVEDLYVVRRKSDDTWTSAKNLGAIINTPYQEITPFLAADNKTLFFSSNGHGGEGSFDVFMSQRLDDTWQNWSEPKNLGKSVNTVGRESAFVFSSEQQVAYFISTQDSEGYGDIKAVKIDAEIDRAVAVQRPKGDSRKDSGAADGQESFIKKQMVEVTGRVVDAKSEQGLTGAKIVFESSAGLDRYTAVTNTQGRYRMEVSAHEDYKVKVSALKYMPANTSLREEKLFANYTNNFSLEPMVEGNTVALDHVLFKRGTPELLPESSDELDMVVEMMKLNSEIRIFLSGHTDNQGKASENVRLSKDRVNAVTRYLVDKGIDQSRITGKGFGGTKPRASNANPETRKLNRRVEFTVHYKN